MLQLNTACAASVFGTEGESGEKVTMNAVLQSTPVNGVLSIVPVTFEGFAPLLAGCSYNARIACKQR